jgi:hypothetical protein
MSDSPRPRCPACRHSTTVTVCSACMASAAANLRRLPELVQALSDGAGVPSSAELAEYVSGGAFVSRPPMALAALSLVAVTPEAIVNILADPTPPIGGTGDSIPLWVVSWAATWRSRYDHHMPIQPRRPPPPTPEWMWARDPRWRAIQLGALMDDRARQAQTGGQVLLGLGPAGVRKGRDVVETAWLARFGTARHAHRFMSDLSYLTTWQDQALVEFDDAAQYVLGLRSLVSQADSVLGRQSTVIYLGRCPEVLTDRQGREQLIELPDGTYEVVRCGGRLTRDTSITLAAGVAVVCPRCRKETPERGLWALARAIQTAYGTVMNRDDWVGHG